MRKPGDSTIGTGKKAGTGSGGGATDGISTSTAGIIGPKAEALPGQRPQADARQFRLLHTSLPATISPVAEKDGITGAGGAPGSDVAPSILSLPEPVCQDAKAGVWLYQGDCLEILDRIAQSCPEGSIDVVFADPPYFLSNGGITCQSGRMVKVDKGEWDKSQGAERNHEFNLEWLRRCQRVLKPNGSIWVTGTQHVIFSVGYAMQQLGFKILNEIAWEKPNPPPNLSCRYFTHSTETVIWAARSAKARHMFNYKAMRQMNGGKQMKTVWKIKAPSRAEKEFGKHPTQKPVALVERCLLASSNPGDFVLDPFVGAGTTAVAALKTGRRCIGIDRDRASIQLAVKRARHMMQQRSQIQLALG